MSAPWGAQAAAAIEDDARTLGGTVGPQTCLRCEGTGREISEGVTRVPTGTPPLEIRACRDCGGDGRQTCDRCGDEPAAATVGDEALCAGCMSMAADNARDEAAGAAQDALPDASRCAWCRAWASKADRLRAEAGARITHGICATCLHAMEAL